MKSPFPCAYLSFVYLLSEKMSFRILCPFFIWVGWKELLQYILIRSPLPEICFANIFSQSVCEFCFVNGVH